MSRKPIARPPTEDAVILTITNNHLSECGYPPQLSFDAGLLAYFENEYCEQTVLQLDRATGRCRLWRGDGGWGDELVVEQFRGRTVICRDGPWPAALDAPGGMAAANAALRKRVHARLRKSFGRPRLTDAECDRLTGDVGISKVERDAIFALYRLWSQVPQPQLR